MLTDLLIKPLKYVKLKRLSGKYNLGDYANNDVIEEDVGRSGKNNAMPSICVNQAFAASAFVY